MRPSSHGRPVRIGLALAATLAAAPLACAPDEQPTAPRAAAPPRFSLGPTVTVTNTDDAGPGSLRQAIADVDVGGTIDFDPSIAGQTITLVSGPLFLGRPMTIQGPVSGGMTISGGGASSVFTEEDYGTAGPTLRNLTITGGAADNGAGIRILIGPLTLDHSTVSGNHATNYGGGIMNGGSLTVVNSTISNNQADLRGGGIFGGNISLTSSTVAENTSSQGGGISTGGTGKSLLVRNSIFANHTQGDPFSINCEIVVGTSVARAGTNLASEESCGAAGDAMILGDPKLGPLAANGGPTKTHALLGDSPAIDAATDCTVGDDQRYVTRQGQGSSCDIGAYEFDSYVKVTITIDPAAAVNNKTGVALVTGTVACTLPFAGPFTAQLGVALKQQQKAGKVSYTLQASSQASVTCSSSPTPWSAFLKPATGAFQSGAATASAQTANTQSYVTPASTTAAVKLFWTKG